jgi:thiol:disulfide interchange protein DsbD
MPALLDFSAAWCAPCQRFETDVFSDPAVHAELEARYMPVKFDVTNDDDDDRVHKVEWNAASLPTVILVGPDGREARRFQGELPSLDEFLTAIRAVR